MEGSALTKDQVLACARYEFHQGKPVFEAYQNFCKTMGDGAMTYKDFDFWWYRFANGQNDLDYDRSKNPETREFSDFPMEILKKFIEKLEWKEKLVLRNVSKGLRESVDNLKHSFKRIELQVNDGFIDLKIDSESWDHRGEIGWKQALTYLGIILKWPKMKTETLWIEYNKIENEQKMSELVKETKNIFSSLNHQILTKDLYLDVPNVDGILAVLPYLKPEVLEAIRILNPHSFNPPFINLQDIIQLDQWKKAKSLDVERKICPIESLLHFNFIRIVLQSITVEEFLNIKNTFIASPNFVRCLIYLEDKLAMEPLQSVAADDREIPIPETNQLFRIIFDRDENTLEFERISNNRFLRF